MSLGPPRLSLLQRVKHEKYFPNDHVWGSNGKRRLNLACAIVRPAAACGDGPSAVIFCPSLMLPYSDAGMVVETDSMLGCHASMICAGHLPQPQIHEAGQHVWPEIVHWFPCDPRDGLCHYLLAHSTLIPCRSSGLPGSDTRRPTLELPAPASAQVPITFDWHCWCMASAQDLHAVYLCRMQVGSMRPPTQPVATRLIQSS